jgi:hypothetical protein
MPIQQQQQPGVNLNQVLQDGQTPAAAAAAAATPPPPVADSSSSSSQPSLSNVPGAAAATLSVAPGTVSQVAAAGVPDRCIIAGSSLFSSCAVEIATAQKRFNISVDVIAPQVSRFESRSYNAVSKVKTLCSTSQRHVPRTCPVKTPAGRR